MFSGALKSSVFAKWWQDASGETTSGATRAPVDTLPAGMRLVVVCNDADTEDKRERLSTLSAIVSCPAPRFSLGVRNGSGVPWICGTYISSTTKQLALDDGGHAEHSVSFSFSIQFRPTYGSDPVPQEIGLQIAKETKNLGILEIVDLKLEFRDKFGLKECPFAMQIDPG